MSDVASRQMRKLTSPEPHYPRFPSSADIEAMAHEIVADKGCTYREALHDIQKKYPGAIERWARKGQ
jgi:hypothetical protein